MFTQNKIKKKKRENMIMKESEKYRRKRDEIKLHQIKFLLLQFTFRFFYPQMLELNFGTRNISAN